MESSEPVCWWLARRRTRRSPHGLTGGICKRRTQDSRFTQRGAVARHLYSLFPKIEKACSANSMPWRKNCNILFHICCILAIRSSIENGIGRSKEREWLISASAGSPELYEIVTVKPIQFLPTFANSAFPNGRSLWKIYLPANSVSWRNHPPSYIKSLLHGIKYKCKYIEPWNEEDLTFQFY